MVGAHNGEICWREGHMVGGHNGEIWCCEGHRAQPKNLVSHGVHLTQGAPAQIFGGKNPVAASFSFFFFDCFFCCCLEVKPWVRAASFTQLCSLSVSPLVFPPTFSLVSPLVFPLTFSLASSENVTITQEGKTYKLAKNTFRKCVFLLLNEERMLQEWMNPIPKTNRRASIFL